MAAADPNPGAASSSLERRGSDRQRRSGEGSRSEAATRSRAVARSDLSLSSGDAAPFGVYLHWPFCLSKCPYCDFNSHVRHAPIDQARYVRAFAAEIAATSARAPGRTVATIFFGGGTPSLMAPATVGAILDAVAAHWTIAADVEDDLHIVAVRR